MPDCKVVVIGAGPAGISAANTLANAGLRPTIVDEASRRGGQIYRDPHPALRRSARALYGFEAGKAERLHRSFDALGHHIDYRPGTTIWAIEGQLIHAFCDGTPLVLPWDRIILATGAMDRVIPFPGWTLPGVYTLGAAQIALKAQACAIGARVVFLGTGPLLYLAACQYLKAGIDVRAVIDTSPIGAQFAALPQLAEGGRALLKGLYFVARLMAGRVPIFRGAVPVECQSGQNGTVSAFRFKDAKGRERRIDCDAVGFGYGLSSQSQLADLLDLSFQFDALQRQWIPVDDGKGRGSVAGIYLAGDGARIAGADVAELTGEQAALSLLDDLGHHGDPARMRAVKTSIDRLKPFRKALDASAFAFPVQLAASIPDETIICRCEGITAGTLRRSIADLQVSEINRLKAFTRLGMGRCQGRVCGPAAAEILASATERPIETVGRLRAQAPIKPIPLQVFARTAT